MKKKHVLALLMSAVMACSVLAGCSGADDSTQKEEASGTAEESKGQEESTEAEESEATDEEKPVLTISCCVDPITNSDPEMMAAYEMAAEIAGVQLEYITTPVMEYEMKVVVTNEGGNPPDLAVINAQKQMSAINAGALMPLDEYIEKDLDKSLFADIAWDSGTWLGDGKMYSMLMGLHLRGLYYNTDYISEAPDTWDELIEMAMKVMDEHEGVQGLGGIEVVAPMTCLNSLAWGLGGKMGNDDGTAAWASEEYETAIQLWSDMYNEYGVIPEAVITGTGNDVEQFSAGNFAFLVGGNYTLPSLLEGEVAKAGKLGYAPMPAMEEGGDRPTFTNGFGFAIPANSANPDLAWEFIKAFYDPAVQVAWAKAEGSLPVILEAQEDPMFSEGFYKQFVDNVNENGRPMDPFVYYNEAKKALSDVVINYCLDPSQDLASMLQESQDSFNEQYCQ